MTREDVLRKAVEGFERDLQDLAYKAPEQFPGWHRATLASVVRALAEADALPSDAERWQFTHADVSWLHTTADTPERRAALAKLTQMANAQSGPAT
jgi:hypothetical protein